MQIQVLVTETLNEASADHRFTASWVVPWWPQHHNTLVVYGRSQSEVMERMRAALKKAMAEREVRVTTHMLEV